MFAVLPGITGFKCVLDSVPTRWELAREATCVRGIRIFCSTIALLSESRLHDPIAAVLELAIGNRILSCIHNLDA